MAEHSKFFSLNILLFLLLLTIPLKELRAVNSLDVVVNEIAWMGTETSYYDEWIELYNNNDFPVVLSGWKLKVAGESLKINLSKEIPAKGFYLLERTDESTLPEFTANQIYNGALSNQGERLELYDNYGNLIDFVDCSVGWFAGDNKTKQTMERKNSKNSGTKINWQTSLRPNGTPGAQNSSGIQLKQESEPKPFENELSQKESKKELAAINEYFPEKLPFNSLLIAFLMAMLSSIIILFLKKEIQKDI